MTISPCTKPVMTSPVTGTTTAIPNDLPDILRSGRPHLVSAVTPNSNGSTAANHTPITISEPVYLPSIQPSGSYPLSAISLRSSLLGTAFGVCSSLAIYLLSDGSPLWRAPFFIASLAVFHFLEFYVTALYNTPLARVDAFLLTQNGLAYNAAHSLAILETLIVHWFGVYQGLLPSWFSSFLVITGLGMMCMGQTVRSVAMAHAGTSFNHTVQKYKHKGHVLVTDGVYGFLRHPSYFGFFWWGLGTQLVLGNVFCFLGYSAILWKFFQLRIKEEEKYLNRFFGDDYEEYRSRTGVGIPFIS